MRGTTTVKIDNPISEDSLHQFSQGHYGNFSLKCPFCLENGIFSPPLQNDCYSHDTERVYGLRRCPNPTCHGNIFIVFQNGSRKVIKTYPGIKIPFDKARLPQKVINAFEEAIVCHSNNCFIGAAILIRKTLEEVAEDKGIKAKTLFDRLKLLGQTIVIPVELIHAMDELRLLGNDAAHVESKTYDEIGHDEIEISIEFTKEILKATYQYEGLLEKMRSLKKPALTESSNNGS